MHDKETFDWKKHLEEALHKTNFCCLGTVDENHGVWTNPVYFAWDETYNFFFISQMHSRHMQNISKNENISLSIYSTAQEGDVVGVQLEGKAKILSDKIEIVEAFKTYHGRTGGGSDVQQYFVDPTWLFVKISSQHIYYFDTRFFEEARQEIPMHILK